MAATILSALTAYTNVIHDIGITIVEFIINAIVTVVHYGLIWIAKQIMVLFKINANILDTTHVIGKIISTYGGAFRALGGSVLILIATWQIFKGFFSFMNLGTEPEEGWKIGIKCLLFGILVFESQEICREILKIFDAFMEGFNINAALKLKVVEQFTNSIEYAKTYFSRDLSTVITSLFIDEHTVELIVMFVEGVFLLLFDIKIIGIALDLSEKYIKLAILIIVSPLSFACGVSKATSQIFNSWVKSFTGLLASSAVKYALLSLFAYTVNEGMFSVSGVTDAIKGAIIMIALAGLIEQSDELVSELGFSPGRATKGVSGVLSKPLMAGVNMANAYGQARLSQKSGGGGGQGVSSKLG